MIGRADIEGSKSNVALNAWLPQASYPCGNFSDTSSLKLLKSKRIDRPCFHSLYSYWKSKSNESLWPFPLHEISVLIETHLWTPALCFNRCAAPAKLPTRLLSSTQDHDRERQRTSPLLPSRLLPQAMSPIVKTNPHSATSLHHWISKLTLKSGGITRLTLLPQRLPPILYLLKSIHKVWLESSSTGSSFPADYCQARSPWLWFRWIADWDSGNLINPFMRVTN